MRLVEGVVVVVACLGVPDAALACGGLFCAQAGPQAPQPVDQSAERIVFTVARTGTITAHVQIQYAGAPEGFAWVVPVPSVPAVEESSIAFIDALDQSSRM